MTSAQPLGEPQPPAGAGPDVPARIRLLIVDDDALVRAGLAMILGGDRSIEIVGQAGDGETAVAQVDALRPDVVLMDIRMPRCNGVAATEQIVARHGDEVRVLVLTTFDADDLVVSAMRAGASGFLLKDTPPAQLVSAVRTVSEGRPSVSPSALRALIAHVGASSSEAGAAQDEARSAAAARLATLTARELDVARAVARGLSNADISTELYLSVPTVKTHVSHLLTKLDCGNRVQLALLVHDATR